MSEDNKKWIDPSSYFLLPERPAYLLLVGVCYPLSLDKEGMPEQDAILRQHPLPRSDSEVASALQRIPHPRERLAFAMAAIVRRLEHGLYISEEGPLQEDAA